jgi:hypothetical protein
MARCRHGLLHVAAACLLTSASTALPQSPMPEGAPLTWVQAATDNEVSIIAAEGTLPISYRQRKIDARGDTMREIVESKDGSVARLIERNGQPITAAEDTAERGRLTDLLGTPDAFVHHHRHDASSRDMAIQLIKLLPQAMVYAYTPGQPQPHGVEGQQIVIDYKPDPGFHPPSMAADLLTGIQGRVWIDQRARRVTRMEAHILHPVNFGYGMIAKIFSGGTVEFEQVNALGDRWLFHHMEEHLTVRELMVKTVPQNNEMTSFDFHALPALLPYQDAIKLLLAMQLPVH